MDETLKLELEAVDKLQALDKMLEKLVGIDKSIAGINDALSQVSKLTPFIKLSAQINIAKGALGLFKSALGGVVGLLEKGFDLGKSFIGQALQGQGFKQQTIFAFEKLFKSREEAEKQYANVFKIAGSTPGTAEGLVNATTKFAGARFSQPEIDTLQGLYADIQAFKGEETASRLTDTISKIKGQGKLTGESLRDEAINVIGREPIELEIGKRLKLTGKPEEIKKQVEALISKGKVAPNVAIGAIVSASKGLLGEQKTGEYAKGLASTSVLGALSNVEEAIPNLFRTISVKSLPSLTSFLVSISDAFQDEGFKTSIASSLDALFEPLKKIKKEDIVEVFKKIGKAIEYAGKLAGSAFEKLLDIINDISKKGIGSFLTDTLSSAVTGLKDLFLYLGRLLGKAVLESLPRILGGGGGGADVDASIKAFEDKTAAAKAVQESLGEDGLPKNAPSVGQSALSVVGLPSVAPGSSTGNIVVNNNIHVEGEANADEIAAKAGEKTKAAVIAGHKEARNAARMKGLSN